MKINTLTLASITTGFRLVSDMNMVYGGVKEFVGYSPFTHQLPRLMKAIEPHVLEHVPGFPSSADSADITPENAHAFISELLAKWGEEIEVPPMDTPPPEGDALAELEAVFGRDRVIPVVR